MNSLKLQLVQQAASQVGVREIGGNNCGADVRRYQRATWLEPGPWPWCAAFVAWCLREALLSKEGMLYLGANLIDAWRCRDASAFGWIQWAQARRLDVLPNTVLPMAGDIVVFDFNGPAIGGGHIGIVEISATDRTRIATIEGNTNGQGDRESVAGDGVWRKVRHAALVKNFIRLGDHAS